MKLLEKVKVLSLNGVIHLKFRMSFIFLLMIRDWRSLGLRIKRRLTIISTMVGNESKTVQFKMDALSRQSK